jgi:peptidoglycan/LPS O-acetylase OafA/YrhL
MLALCGCLSLLVFLPGDLRFVGAGIVNAALYTSNILFYTVANDYFAAGTLDLQPVLHTWSLAVEGQFYLVYPLLLLALRRWSWPLVATLVGLAGLSFAASAWGALHSPTATFYLLPTRGWELLLGGLLALRPAPARTLPGEAWTGLGLIAAAALAYTRTTPFPGAAALLPCLGTVLVLRAGAVAGGRANRLLTAAPMVFIGRISYSLYLWHWPLLVFAAYRTTGDLGVAAKLGLVTLSFGLAVLSWWAIERPLIGRRVLSTRKALFAGAVGGTLLAASVGTLLDQAGRGRVALTLLPPQVAAVADAQFDMIRDECLPAGFASAGTFPCRFGAPGRPPSLVLWGNSYARMWAPTLDIDARAHGAAGLSILLSKCLPLLGVKFRAAPDCTAFNDAAFAAIRGRPELKTVILGANWFAAGADLEDLGATIDALQTLGRRVVVIASPPQPTFMVPRVLALAALRHAPPPPALDEAQTEAALKPSSDIIEALRRRYGFTVIDPADWLCDGVHCDVERNGMPLYFDAGHVTASAARQAIGLFDPIFAPEQATP